MTYTPIRVLSFLTICLSILSLPTIGISQKKKDEKKVTTAIERAKKATEVLKQVAALPEDKGIPKDITEKMNLVGVIPDASQLSLLFSKGFRGHGISCLRQDNGWSLPAFYFFGQANGFDLTGVSYKHFDLIMVVVGAKTKPKKDKEKDKANPPSADKKDKPDKPRSYFYIFAEGLLKPVALKTGFLDALLGAQITIAYDNKLNKAVYGVKGDDVFLGKIDVARQSPSEVTVFRDALNATYPVKR